MPLRKRNEAECFNDDSRAFRRFRLSLKTRLNWLISESRRRLGENHLAHNEGGGMLSNVFNAKVNGVYIYRLFKKKKVVHFI